MYYRIDNDSEMKIFEGNGTESCNEFRKTLILLNKFGNWYMWRHDPI